MANRYENRKDIKTSIHIHTQREMLYGDAIHILQILNMKHQLHSSYQREKGTIIDRTSIQYIKSVEPKVMTIMIMIITIYTKRKKM